MQTNTPNANDPIYIPDPLTGSDAQGAPNAGAPSSLVQVFSFRGAELAPYSATARIVWLNLQSEGDHNYFAGIILVWLLLNSAAVYEAAIRRGASTETAWAQARAFAIRAANTKAATRDVIYSWAGEIGFAGQNECVTLAGRILDEADLADITTDGEAAGDTDWPGK